MPQSTPRPTPLSTPSRTSSSGSRDPYDSARLTVSRHAQSESSETEPSAAQRKGRTSQRPPALVLQRSGSRSSAAARALASPSSLSATSSPPSPYTRQFSTRSVVVVGHDDEKRDEEERHGLATPTQTTHFVVLSEWFEDSFRLDDDGVRRDDGGRGEEENELGVPPPRGDPERRMVASFACRVCGCNVA
ncbi:hypothetical protein JCM3766R1_001181 [Sporobolomyces carnicolor]